MSFNIPGSPNSFPFGPNDFGMDRKYHTISASHAPAVSDVRNRATTLLIAPAPSGRLVYSPGKYAYAFEATHEIVIADFIIKLQSLGVNSNVRMIEGDDKIIFEGCIEGDAIPVNDAAQFIRDLCACYGWKKPTMKKLNDGIRLFDGGVILSTRRGTGKKWSRRPSKVNSPTIGQLTPEAIDTFRAFCQNWVGKAEYPVKVHDTIDARKEAAERYDRFVREQSVAQQKKVLQQVQLEKELQDAEYESQMHRKKMELELRQSKLESLKSFYEYLVKVEKKKEAEEILQQMMKLQLQDV